jgi:hypothetical protein
VPTPALADKGSADPADINRASKVDADRWDKPISERSSSGAFPKVDTDSMPTPKVSQPSQPSRDSHHDGEFSGLDDLLAGASPKSTVKETPVEPPKPQVESPSLPPQTAAPAVAQDKQPMTDAEAEAQARRLFGTPVDLEISSVFQRALVGPKTKTDRFDQPISARMKSAESDTVPAPADEEKKDTEPSAASTQIPGGCAPIETKADLEQAVVDAAEQKGLFASGVDGEISGIFNLKDVPPRMQSRQQPAEMRSVISMTKKKQKKQQLPPR